MGIISNLTSLRWWLGIRPKFVFKGIPKLSLAVVIPAYNEEASIANTIRSVQNQTYPVDEIYVVDDSSSDRTGAIAESLGVKVLRTPKNQGTKSRALNCALENIHCDLVATIDADTHLASDAIERALPYFNEEKTFAVCGLVIPQKIESLWERGRTIEYLYGVTIMKAAQNNFGLVMVASGCFTIFRNKYLKELGLFKERSIAEDMDLTWEAHFKGYRVYCEIGAYCYPLDPPTMKIYYKQLRRWYSGFLQCMAIHKWNLCRHWQFGAVYLFYLIESALFPLIAFAFTVLYVSYVGSWKLIALLVVIHELFVIVPSLFRGWRAGMFWKTLASFPAFYITRPINMAALYVSIFQEWFLNKKLAIWDKGH